jgi:hypothetical protein
MEAIFGPYRICNTEGKNFFSSKEKKGKGIEVEDSFEEKERAPGK